MKNMKTKDEGRRRLEACKRMVEKAPSSVRRIPVWESGRVEWPALIILSGGRNSSG
jgi:hypothetical protein